MKTRGFLQRVRANGFRDRREAGRALAQALSQYGTEAAGSTAADVLVIGLARGGVPVAAEVAAELGAPLDVAVVRKLGVPGHEELALGAITRGRMVLNDDLVAELGIGQQEIQAIVERERRELNRRESAYRKGRPPAEFAGRTVILVDDGVATGASMRAAALTIRDAGAARVVIAVPTGPDSVSQMFDDAADEVVCIHTPRPFIAVGLSYRDFNQVQDDEVTAALTGGDPRD